ncbi:hypothetical protein KQ940_08440 [Marinobacterium sp. D7]|uniref:hypothetical protein n=1 Tax=Marinobacterium ramblicola TaxID=2849041 RepID=UPI001C2D5951|nr:hypothetical protein [Marinobacterium ramblicola]MBV1788082.1 hypothetical protein [Marinobacterium ramblicola]
MKTPTLILTLALSIASPFGWAQQEHHPDADAQSGSVAATTGATLQASMQERLDRMQTLADRLAATGDPAQRRELMEEHRKAMTEFRGMMGGMQQQGGGMGMMGGMPQGGGMGMGMGMMSMMGSQMDCVGMMEAYRQMDKRLDLMQQLLEQRQDK